MGDKPLAVQFPSLYNCARNQEAKINDYLDKSSHQVSWSPIFGNQKSLECFVSYSHSRRWNWLQSLVRLSGWHLLYDFILPFSTISLGDIHWDFLWKTKAPPRILVFGWLTLHGRILTTKPTSEEYDSSQCLPFVPLYRGIGQPSSSKLQGGLQSLEFGTKWDWLKLGPSTNHCWLVQCLHVRCRISKRQDFMASLFSCNNLGHLERKESKMLWRKSCHCWRIFFKDQVKRCSLGLPFSPVLGHIHILHCSKLEGGNYLIAWVVSFPSPSFWLS